MTFYRSRLPVLGRKRMVELGVLKDNNTEHIDCVEEAQEGVEETQDE